MMMASFDRNYQNPSFSFRYEFPDKVYERCMIIGPFVIKTPVWFRNLNNEVKAIINCGVMMKSSICAIGFCLDALFTEMLLPSDTFVNCPIISGYLSLCPRHSKNIVVFC